MVEIKGKSNIKAKVLCDSISQDGIRLISFEIEYPRIVHSELLVHSMLARNAASSRAIPFNKMVQQLKGIPARFGGNQGGMQDNGEHNAPVVLTNSLVDSGSSYTPEEAWEAAKDSAVMFSKAFHEAGYHKQVVNRLTEPFQLIKTVITGTEWDNWFWLRDHTDADPTIHELARCMYEAKEQSVPDSLKAGQWHLPYVDYNKEYDQHLVINNDGIVKPLTIDQARKVSAARTAAVSFRNVDYTLEKCLEIYERLIGADRKHASAFGHQCTPMMPVGYQEDTMGKYRFTNFPNDPLTWQDGVSHVDRNNQLWSAMMRGWIQFRKLIPEENYTTYS